MAAARHGREEQSHKSTAQLHGSGATKVFIFELVSVQIPA